MRESFAFFKGAHICIANHIELRAVAWAKFLAMMLITKTETEKPRILIVEIVEREGTGARFNTGWPSE